MIRFIHCADLHFKNCFPYSKLNLELNINQRFLYQLKLFETISKYAVKNNISHILISGDIFDYANPSSREKDCVFNLLATVRDAGIKLILIDGNHDTNGFWSALGYLKKFDIRDISIFSKNPESIKFNNSETGGHKILAVPYNTKQDIDLIKKHYNNEDVIMLHGAIIGADMGHSFMAKDGFILEELQELNCPYIAMGDFHTNQVWKNKDNYIAYAGSLLAIDFKEFDSQQKYFMDVTISEGKTNLKRIKLPTINPLLEFNVETNSYKDFSMAEKKEDAVVFTNAIIKILYKKNNSIIIKELTEKFKNLGVSYIIAEPLISDKIVMSLNESNSNANINSLNMEQVIKEFCKIKNFDSELSLKIYKKAKEENFTEKVKDYE